MPIHSLTYAAEKDVVVWERTMSYQISMRQKIDTHLILERLMRHVLGLEPMLISELTAARILLDRTMPTLQAIQVSVESSTPVSKGDIDAMLMASGLSPEREWQALEHEAVPDTGRAENED